MPNIILKFTTASLGVLSCFVASQSWAQESPANNTNLSTMEVTAPRLARELYDTPAAVSTIDREAIAQGQQRARLGTMIAGNRFAPS